MLPSKPSAPRAGITQSWLWLGYAACMALAIPWYRKSGTIDPRWLGIPLWGWCAVAGAVGMSLLTLLAVGRLWPDPDGGEKGDG